MKRTFPALLLITLSFVACQNKRITTNTDDTSSVKNAVTTADTLSYRYDSVKVYSKIPISIDKQISDTAKATFTFPVFADAELNVMVEKDALQVNNPHARNYTSYKDLATDFIKEFDDFKKENPDSFQSWFKMVNINVLPQWKNYLGLEYTFFDYLGGAHPNTVVTYKNYNLSEKKPVVLSEIIKPENKEELTRIAEKIFRKNEGLSAEAGLKENYFFDKGIFTLNDNFYLTPEGITFLYNSYEIKAYVYGRTKLFIPYSSIQHILVNHAVLPVYK